MKKLAIIGSTGLLGSDLVEFLNPYFDITSIYRDNYSIHINKKFDIVINANGNSKRFWAELHPGDDFTASTASVHDSVFDFPCDLYIYISSPDVYPDHSARAKTSEKEKIDSSKLSSYGFHKYLSELIVKKYKKKFLILRSAMILGTNLKKGPIFDIIVGKPLFVTSSTQLQIITTGAIADIVRSLIKQKVVNETINIGGAGTFSFKNIDKIFNKKIKYSKEAKLQIYEMNVSKLKKFYPNLKASEEYLDDFLKASSS